jgi:hypothetical protein
VHDARIVRIDDGRKFQTQYNKLLAAYRRLVASGATQRNILTPQEQQLLDKQQHVGWAELGDREQKQLQREVDSLFGQIPAHLQEKARNLAGVN